MLHIAVVEDSKEYVQIMQNYLRQFGEETHTLIEVDTFYDGMSFLDEYTGKYQVVFMDISMPNMNGMDAAERLRKIDEDVCLIFLTSMAQYAIQGYEVSAMDFILKPVTYELFKIRFQKVVSHIHLENYYTVKTSSGLKKISIDKLQYIESNKHYLHFHTKDGECRMRGRMRDITSEFEQQGFTFINSSLLVNLAYIEEIHGNVVTVGEENFTIARAYKTKFREKLTEYMGGI